MIRFLSRFLRPGKDEDNLEEIWETLGADAEDGLFMPTGSQRGRPEEEGEPAAEAGDSDALSAPEAPQGEAATMDLGEGAERQSPPDDPPEAIQTGAPASGPTEAAQGAAAGADQLEAPAGQETAATTGPAEPESSAEEESSGEQDDDPLSAFRSTAVLSGTSNLTSELEDTPIEELLTGLRETRNMLPPTPGAADSAAGEDGEG